MIAMLRPVTDGSYVSSIPRIYEDSTKHQTVSPRHNHLLAALEDPDRLPLFYGACWTRVWYPPPCLKAEKQRTVVVGDTACTSQR